MTVHAPTHHRSVGAAQRWHRVGLLWRVGWRAFGRRALRDNDVAIIVLAALLGVCSGIGVTVLRRGVAAFHAVAFNVPLLGHLSDSGPLDWWRVLLVPCLGGLLVGLVAWAIKQRRPHDIVDAIEANALFGGRMSLTDSINLGVITLLSGGVGASVGLEAAYTQLGAGFCSKAGTLLRLRRDDLRTLVGCGAGAAIAAAFNAPFTGAFYAFELIIGSYTLATFAPVLMAAVTGTMTARIVFGTEPIFAVNRPVHLAPMDYALFVVLGVASALVGIAAMRGVTTTEQWFQARSTPRWLRPAVGGLVLGAMALVYPEILGSGHGGIIASLHFGYGLPYLGGLCAAKIAASAISIGAGFRGGMFSSSLFLGSIVGAAAALLIRFLAPGYPVDALAFTLVGMGSVAAGVVGAPITMILLVLETTGDFSATIGVTVGVLTTSVAVRHWFGYSFATWRFHLRGLKIRSPEDIGWLEELKVGRLMRGDAKTVPVAMTIAGLRDAFPIGSTKQVFALDAGHLAGVVDLAEAHSPDLGGPAEILTVGELIHGAPSYLVPGEDVRSALAKFGEAQVETLPVVDDPEERHVIGYLTEAYALRRYNQELERRRGEGSEESALYSSAVRPRT